jgi:hypothetical protein
VTREERKGWHATPAGHHPLKPHIYVCVCVRERERDRIIYMILSFHSYIESTTFCINLFVKCELEFYGVDRLHINISTSERKENCR